MHGNSSSAAAGNKVQLVSIPTRAGSSQHCLDTIHVSNPSRLDFPAVFMAGGGSTPQSRAHHHGKALISRGCAFDEATQTCAATAAPPNLAGCGADFGNGFYNDHHYHYGYFASFRRADTPPTNRGAAAALTRGSRGPESRRRRGRDARASAVPSRGDAAAATWGSVETNRSDAAAVDMPRRDESTRTFGRRDRRHPLGTP